MILQDLFGVFSLLYKLSLKLFNFFFFLLDRSSKIKMKLILCDIG